MTKKICEANGCFVSFRLRTTAVGRCNANQLALVPRSTGNPIVEVAEVWIDEFRAICKEKKKLQIVNEEL